MLSEKVDEDNSILLHKCGTEKVKRHFMRYVSVHCHGNRNKPPAQIAFNIQTLLNVQFISSSMETSFFFLEKLLLFFLLFSVFSKVYEYLTLLE